MARESLTDQSDEALASQAKENDKDAAAVLTSRYFRLIQKLASPYRHFLDFDDLCQEGSIGLLDAINGYQPQKNVPFSAYAAACIRNRIIKFVEKNQTQKASVLNQSLSLEEIQDQAGGESPEQIFIDKESLSHVIEDVNRVLSPLERKVLFLFLAEMDYRSIADTLCITEKSVNNALQRVRKKLKAIHRA